MHNITACRVAALALEISNCVTFGLPDFKMPHAREAIPAHRNDHFTRFKHHTRAGSAATVKTVMSCEAEDALKNT